MLHRPLPEAPPAIPHCGPRSGPASAERRRGEGWDRAREATEQGPEPLPRTACPWHTAEGSQRSATWDGTAWACGRPGSCLCVNTCTRTASLGVGRARRGRAALFLHPHTHLARAGERVASCMEALHWGCAPLGVRPQNPPGCCEQSLQGQGCGQPPAVRTPLSRSLASL